MKYGWHRVHCKTFGSRRRQSQQKYVLITTATFKTKHEIPGSQRKRHDTIHLVLPLICRMRLLILGQSKFPAWVPHHPSLFFMQIALPPTCLFSFPPHRPPTPPLFPDTKTSAPSLRQNRDGFWSVGRKEVPGGE